MLGPAGSRTQRLSRGSPNRLTSRLVGSEKKGGVKRAKIGKFPLNATANPDKGGKTRKQKFYYALMAQRGHKRGLGIGAAATKEYNLRRSAKGAMAAGFLVSARKLGLKKRGGKAVQPRAGGSALRSIGRRGKPFRKILATSTNAVEGSFEVAQKTMDRAVVAVIRDARKFALNLLQETNNKFQHGRKPRR